MNVVRHSVTIASFLIIGVMLVICAVLRQRSSILEIRDYVDKPYRNNGWRK